MYLNITIDAVLLDKCFFTSVPLEAPQPAHALFDLSSQEFIDHYIKHVPPPLGTLAMQYRHLFEPPCSCTFLQLAIGEGFHSSGLYLCLPRARLATCQRSSCRETTCAPCRKVRLSAAYFLCIWSAWLDVTLPAWLTAFVSSGTSIRRPSSASCLLPRRLCLSAR